jgi:hypothetical protein
MESKGDPAESFRVTIRDTFFEEKTDEVMPDRVARVLELLDNSRIRPFIRRSELGVDGATKKLTLEEGMQSVTYEWWCGAGKGWTALDTISEAIIRIAREVNKIPFTCIGEQPRR